MKKASNKICIEFVWNILFISREGKRGRKKGREISMCHCLLHTPYWGPSPQPRHVSWPGIELVTLCLSGQHSIYSATPARAGFFLLLKGKYLPAPSSVLITTHSCTVGKDQECPLAQGYVRNGTTAITSPLHQILGKKTQRNLNVVSQFKTNNALICTKAYYGICVPIKKGCKGGGKPF